MIADNAQSRSPRRSRPSSQPPDTNKSACCSIGRPRTRSFKSLPGRSRPRMAKRQGQTEGSMSDPFLDRLREALVEPSDSDVNVLRAGATAAASELTPERALTLVRLAHHQGVTDEALADTRSRLNAKGEAIPEQGAQQLIATLAAEALIISFSRTRFATGHIPALAVRCATSVGWNPVHPDVNTHGVSYLSHRSLLVRERVAVPPEPKR